MRLNFKCWNTQTDDVVSITAPWANDGGDPNGDVAYNSNYAGAVSSNAVAVGSRVTWLHTFESGGTNALNHRFLTPDISDRYTVSVKLSAGAYCKVRLSFKGQGRLSLVGGVTTATYSGGDLLDDDDHTIVLATSDLDAVGHYRIVLDGNFNTNEPPASSLYPCDEPGYYSLLTPTTRKGYSVDTCPPIPDPPTRLRKLAPGEGCLIFAIWWAVDAVETIGAAAGAAEMTTATFTVEGGTIVAGDAVEGTAVQTASTLGVNNIGGSSVRAAFLVVPDGEAADVTITAAATTSADAGTGVTDTIIVNNVVEDGEAVAGDTWPESTRSGGETIHNGRHEVIQGARAGTRSHFSIGRGENTVASRTIRYGSGQGQVTPWEGQY